MCKKDRSYSYVIQYLIYKSIVYYHIYIWNIIFYIIHCTAVCGRPDCPLVLARCLPSPAAQSVSVTGGTWTPSLPLQHTTSTQQHMTSTQHINTWHQYREFNTRHQYKESTRDKYRSVLMTNIWF